jgi:dihydroflavonol-4-reductase
VRVLVTGASGLIGGQVCRALQARGHEVSGLVRGVGPVALPADVVVVRGDVTRADSLRTAVEGCDAVVHCAAVYSYDADSSALTRVAVDGTRAVVLAAAAAGVRRVVVTSSSVTCGSSATPDAVDEGHVPGGEFMPAYFRVKQDQERAALDLGAELGIDVVVACPTVVLGGPDRKLVPSNAIVARYLLDLTRTTYPGGCNIVSAEDIGVGHCLLLEHGTAGQRYLLGGENLTWAELHRAIGDLAGVGGPYSEASATAVLAAATVAGWWSEVTGEPPLVTEQEAGTAGRYFWYDDALARGLGWTPGTARDAIASSVSWLVSSDHLPRWVRESLRPRREVYDARPLVARSLQDDSAPRRPRRPVTPVVPPAPG